MQSDDSSASECRWESLFPPATAGVVYFSTWDNPCQELMARSLVRGSMSGNQPPIRTRFFYGWIIVTVAFLSLAIVFGIRLTFSVFLVELTRDFGWSRSGMAGIYSVNMAAAAVVLPFVGRLQDSWGARRLFTLGGITMGIALLASSRIDSLWQLYVTYGILTALGIAILSICLHSAMISRWFSAQGRRGTAIGMALAGTGVGMLVLTPLTDRVIAALGWRNAYLVLAALMLLVAVPMNWLFVRDTPEAIGLHPDGWAPEPEPAPGESVPPSRVWTWHDASRTLRLWALYLAAALALFSLRMISVHQVAHMVDVGYARSAAADAVGVTGAVIAASFIFWGAISDRIGRHKAYLMGGLSLVVATSVLLSLPRLYPSVAPLYVFALFWGIGEGSCTSLLTAIAADMFQGPEVGTIVGTMSAAFATGSGTGSWFGGYGYDTWGSYAVPFSLAVLATLASITIVQVVSRRPGKITGGVA